MKRLALISTVLIVMCAGCKESRPTNLELSNELFDLRKRVHEIEEKQAGLFEAAVSNAEVTGMNTTSITSLVKSLDDLVKQIKTILDIIQRNVVMLLNTSCNPAASLIY